MVTADELPVGVLDALGRLGVGRGPRDVLGGWTSERGRVGTAAVRVVIDSESSAKESDAVDGSVRGATVRARVVVEGRIVSPSYRAGMSAEQVRVALSGLGWSAAMVGREVGVLLGDGGASIPEAVVEAWAVDGVEAERGGAVLWALLAEFAQGTLRALKPPAMVLPVVVPLVPMSSARGRHAAARREMDAVWPDLCGAERDGVLDAKGVVATATGRVGDAEVVVRAAGAVVIERMFVFEAVVGAAGLAARMLVGADARGEADSGQKRRRGRPPKGSGAAAREVGSRAVNQGDPVGTGEGAPRQRLTEPAVEVEVALADSLVVSMLVEQRGPRSIGEVAACLRALHMDGREVLADLCREVPDEFREAVTDRWDAWMRMRAPVEGPVADAMLGVLEARVGWFYARMVNERRSLLGGSAFAKAAASGKGNRDRADLAGDDAATPPKPWWLAAVGGAGQAASVGQSKQSGRLIVADFSVRMPNGSREWFDVGVGVKVDGRYVSLLPILVGLIEAGGMEHAVIVDGQARFDLGGGDVLAMPVDRVRAMLSALEFMLAGGVRRRDTLRVPARFADAVVDIADLVDTDGVDAGAAALLEASLEAAREAAGVLKSSRDVLVPASFLGDLRAYQREGLEWLQALRERGGGGVLADDMGLGKTIQTLAHVAVEKEEGRLEAPVLVVVPTSLVPNWVDEARRFAPGLRVEVRHGPWRAARLELAGVDVVLTTYGVAARDVALLKKVAWHGIVLDEAQAIKNPGSQAAKAVRSLTAGHRVCLTGTPVENNLDELWSLFAFLMPGFLGERTVFGRLYRAPIERGRDVHRMALLKRRVGPFMLRRTKEQVAKELPPKTEVPVRVELGQRQRDLYETIRLSVHEQVRAAVETVGLARSRITVLDALLRLRQVCCDPRLARMGVGRGEAGTAEDGRHGATLRAAGAPASPVAVDAEGGDGSDGGCAADPVTAGRSGGVRSAKLDALMDMVTEMVPEGRRILVFSQFTSMLDLIKPRLDAEGVRWVELTGKTPDRAAPVRRFQAGEVPVFLLSLKAGGRGLNLTAADTVIHYDPWWNPAVENQATDRAYRIGQDKPVFVYKLVATDTVEERILDLQARKGSLAAAVVGDEAAVGALDGRDLDFLFGAGEGEEDGVRVGSGDSVGDRGADKAVRRGGGWFEVGGRGTEDAAASGVGPSEAAGEAARDGDVDVPPPAPALTRRVAVALPRPGVADGGETARVEDAAPAAGGPSGGVDRGGVEPGRSEVRALELGPVPQTGREVMAVVEGLGIDGEQAVDALRQVVGEGWKDRLGGYWEAWEEERTRVPVPRPLGEAVRELPALVERGDVVLAPVLVVGGRGIAQRLLTRRQAPATWEEVSAMVQMVDVPAPAMVAAVAGRMGMGVRVVAAVWNAGMRGRGEVPVALGEAVLAEVMGR